MTKFYSKDNRIFLEVVPSTQLRHSRLITDVLSSGGKFVVDMNTGILTIDRPHLIDNFVAWKTNIERERSKRKYVWWRGSNNGSRKLSDDVQVALVQIADEWALGWKRGRLYIDGQCRVNNDSGIGWIPFVREIKSAYED